MQMMIDAGLAARIAQAKTDLDDAGVELLDGPKMSMDLDWCEFEKAAKRQSRYDHARMDFHVLCNQLADDLVARGAHQLQISESEGD